jgi:hypothetical protein
MSRLFSEFCYWLFPKPADMIAVLYNAIEPQPLASKLADFGRVQEKGEFRPVWSLAASLLFPMMTLAIAGYELEKAEY